MTERAQATIPSTAHFLWIGARLPFVFQMAVRSAAQNGGFARVVLHHERALLEQEDLSFAKAAANVETRLIDDAVFERTPDPRGMRRLYGSLTQPAARTNVLRVATLYAEGGVYLDTDTITLRSFAGLMRSPQVFCGAERIVYPAHVRSSRNPLVQGGAIARSLVRSLCSSVPAGHRLFARLAPLYPLAVNNAVLGAPAGHPFLARMMEAMLAKSEAERQVRFALGTHLLQAMVARYPEQVRVLPPAVFYPLGPEISVHWFREGARAPLEQVLGDDTLLVHWYASVRTNALVPRIAPRYLAERRQRQLFAALVARYLPDAIRAD